VTEIIGFVEQRLDSVKAPTSAHITQTLPGSLFGKILWRAAKELFALGW
jgi:hypothetical protein